MSAQTLSRLFRIHQAEQRAVGFVHNAEHTVSRAFSQLEVATERVFRGLSWLAGDR